MFFCTVLLKIWIMGYVSTTFHIPDSMGMSEHTPKIHGRAVLKPGVLGWLFVL